MGNILLIDNYDSFTYNVSYLIREVSGEPVTVIRNDTITPAQARSYSHIFLSPGPGIPEEAGNMPAIVRECLTTNPIFGICLGHQCIGEAFGGSLKQLETLVHGKATPISILPDCEMFAGIPQRIEVGRYHSWVINPETTPQDLSVTATDDAGEIMAITHKKLPIFGVQFHPESVLTEHGAQMIKNFLRCSQ